MSKNIIICKNCNHSFEGNFCPNCGQKYINKFTWRYLFDLFSRSIELERGFLLNLKDLSIKPVSTITNYVDGKTKNYLNPITYFLIIITLSTLINSLTDSVAYKNFELNVLVESDEMIRLKNIFLMFFFGFALSISLTLFRGKLIENSIISLFVTSQFFLFSTILNIIPGTAGIILSSVIPLIFVIYILYKVLKFKLLKSILSILAILFILMVFTEGGYFISIQLRPYIEKVKVSDQEQTYYQQIQEIQKRVQNNKILLSELDTLKYHEFRIAMKNYIELLDSSKNLVIQVTGGMDLEGGFYGARDKDKSLLALKDYAEKIVVVEKNLSEELNKLNCVKGEMDQFDISTIDNKMMVEVLIRLNHLQLSVLSIELQCYIDEIGSK